jgi:hypothetical protein
MCAERDRGFFRKKIPNCHQLKLTACSRVESHNGNDKREKIIRSPPSTIQILNFDVSDADPAKLIFQEEARSHIMELKTLKAIAMEQSLSIHTLRKFARQGMPHYRVGRKIFIDQEQFESWFAAHFRTYNDKKDDELDKIVNDAISAIIK